MRCMAKIAVNATQEESNVGSLLDRILGNVTQRT